MEKVEIEFKDINNKIRSLLVDQSVEELDLNDFTSSDTYFECPLIPTRGNH